MLDASALDDAEMQAIAADVGYSETAFVTGEGTDRRRALFLAARGGAVLRARDDRHRRRLGRAPRAGRAALHTPAGLVEVTVRDGRPPVATLVSVTPSSAALADEDRAEVLAALHWSDGDLDPALPPRVAYAGAHHPVLAVAAYGALEALDYDFDRLGALMAARDWTTMQLVHRVDADRVPLAQPVPARRRRRGPGHGAAAAAFGGYLRELGLVDVPATVTIHQGVELGRPSLLTVEIPPGDAGISVSGAAVPIG